MPYELQFPGYLLDPEEVAQRLSANYRDLLNSTDDKAEVYLAVESNRIADESDRVYFHRFKTELDFLLS